MRYALVTGSFGLVGSAVVRRLLSEGMLVTGIDNGMRGTFFGPEGAVKNPFEGIPNYRHYSYDLREDLRFGSLTYDLIVHAAAQPSHDWAATDPVADFDINARATLLLLEYARRRCPEAPFVFFSTNKVYGDGPNELPFIEIKTRYEWQRYQDMFGIGEDFSIDRSTHSLFGCSKLSADLMVQEYGRYFGMPTVCLRCGCLTGEGHSGVEQHGFLSYLVRQALRGKTYEIFGYGGKQVRDQLHAEDVAEFVWRYFKNPKPAEVYNLGGGYGNSVSVLEALELVRETAGVTSDVRLNPDPRKGDHRVYYSDLTKAKRDYPGWEVTVTVPEIIKRIIMRWRGCDNNS